MGVQQRLSQSRYGVPHRGAVRGRELVADPYVTSHVQFAMAEAWSPVKAFLSVALFSPSRSTPPFYLLTTTMRAYVYDDIPGDQRKPHDSGNPVAHNTLADLGVIYKRIEIDNNDWEKEIDAFAQERNYKNRDQITVTREGLGEAYEAKIKSFFAEHLHEDEEIRFILGGSGYFDVRGLHAPYDEQWIRIALEKGDLIVLPAGIYHRFTVDENDTITAMRLFQDEPKWVPHEKSQEADSKPARGEYLEKVKEAVGLKA